MKNSAKNTRSADMHRLMNCAKISINAFIEYAEGDYRCALWRVSHAYKDMTKNRHHHSTHARFMTRLRRKAKYI